MSQGPSPADSFLQRILQTHLHSLLERATFKPMTSPIVEIEHQNYKGYQRIMVFFQHIPNISKSLSARGRETFSTLLWIYGCIEMPWPPKVGIPKVSGEPGWWYENCPAAWWYLNWGSKWATGDGQNLIFQLCNQALRKFMNGLITKTV